MTATTQERERAHTYTGAHIPGEMLAERTVVGILEERAARHASEPCLTLVYEGGERTLSFAELNALSHRLASYLRRALDVGPDDVVALLPANDVDSIIAVYAILRAGCRLLLVNPGDPATRVRAQLQTLGATRCLRSRGAAANDLGEAIEIPDPAQLPANGTAAEPRLSPSSTALLFGTSGSTAASKIVAQSHCNAVVNAYAVSQHHGLRRGDRLLGCLPFHHVNGIHFTLFATLFAGAHAVVIHAFDPFTYFDVVDRFRPRIASVVPSLLEGLLDACGECILPRELSYFVSAAAPLTARTARTVQRNFKTRVVQGYGLTETTNFSTTVPTNLSDAAFRRLVLDAEVPSVGIALRGNEVAVLRPDGTRAAAGETGELCMRGHNVMLEYVGNVAATTEAFRHGWFHSGDLGFEVFDPVFGGNHCVIVGRIKNIAKVGGETVSLEEMERALRMLPEVQDSACISRPHRLLGDQIIAAVVLCADLELEQLRQHLRMRFAQAAQPKHIVKLTAIPRTLTGKIRRQDLAAELAALVGDRAH